MRTGGGEARELVVAVAGGVREVGDVSGGREVLQLLDTTGQCEYDVGGPVSLADRSQRRGE
jgi:hypothetical protein